MSPNIAAHFYLAPGAILLLNRVTVNTPAVPVMSLLTWTEKYVILRLPVDEIRLHAV
jgi:hypothetical protein